MNAKFGSLLAAGFFVVASVAAATGNFAVRLESAARVNATNPATQGQISVERILLTQGPSGGYGKYRARSNVIAPGTPFNIYFEPTNLVTRFENGAVRASMSVDILVRDAQGKTAAARDNAWQLPVAIQAASDMPLTELSRDLPVNHLTLADGRYQLVLRIHDDFGGTFVDRTLDIEVRQGAAQPAARLSQSQQGQTR
jgi:hypothetical protein